MKRTFTGACYCLILGISFLAPRLSRAQSTTNFDVEVAAGNCFILKTLSLSGNRLGVLATEDGNSIFLWIYNSAGVQTGNVNITAQFNWPHTTHIFVNFNAVTTNNGNIFISYVASSNSTGIQTYNARYVVINETGAVQASGQLNNTDAGGNYIGSILLDKLSDGKIMAVWRQMANSTIVFRLFNENGTAFTNDVAFAGPGTPNSFMTNIYIFKAAAGKNGNFLISLYYYNGDMRGFAFDNNGNNAISGGASSFAIDPTINNNYGNNAILAMANGNFAVSWWLSGANYVKILSQDGSTVIDKLSIPTTSVNGMIPLYTSGSEGFIVTEMVMQNPSDMSNPYSTMWLHRYNQSGVLQSSAAMPEGALIRPSYNFTQGGSGGYAYLYSYYKSFMVMGMPPMGMAMMTGDMDTRGVTNGFAMGTLPVSLISYNVKLLNNQKAQLTWSTASEINNSHFEIEKSSDGRNFIFIGRVTANGNAGGGSGYSFTDPETISRNTYYRLKQFDIDGKWKDLGIKLVSTGSHTIAASAYPNPVKGNSITLFAGDEPLPAAWSITDAQGRIIKTGTLRQSQEQLVVYELAKGIYFLRIGTKQVIKLKK